MKKEEILKLATLFNGDNIEVLKTLPENSIDSIVTDPPYGISFMNKKWDHNVPSVEFWKEIFRVLKPGGHILSFGGTQTYHRMVGYIEDAGFEIRDQIMWIYGSGFPKSHNIGKSVEKIQGQSEWEGWGTGLKPANEPICVARKPISEKSIASNVLKHGTGGINIDGCRIGNESITTQGFGDTGFVSSKNYKPTNHQGRFPANVILECICDEPHDNPHCPCFQLDEQSGTLKSGKMGPQHTRHTDGSPNGIYGKFNPNHELGETYGDTGGASRFFYVAKASKKERNLGMKKNVETFIQRPRRLDGSVIYKETHPEEWNQVMKNLSRQDKTSKAAAEEKLQSQNNGEKNTHPTIKPIELMRYLVRLVTPKGGVVLDPFMGSGSTGVAALIEDFRFVGIEMDEIYFEIATQRVNSHKDFSEFFEEKERKKEKSKARSKKKNPGDDPKLGFWSGRGLNMAA